MSFLDFTPFRLLEPVAISSCLATNKDSGFVSKFIADSKRLHHLAVSSGCMQSLELLQGTGMLFRAQQLISELAPPNKAALNPASLQTRLVCVAPPPSHTMGTPEKIVLGV